MEKVHIIVLINKMGCCKKCKKNYNYKKKSEIKIKINGG